MKTLNETTQQSTRAGRYGKDFVACSGFPKCRYIQKNNKKEEKDDEKTNG